MKKKLANLLTMVIPIKKHRKKIRDNLIKKKKMDLQPIKIENTINPNTLKEKLNISHETCFIIGNSPSNKKLNLSLLNEQFTITVGSGFKQKNLGLEKSTIHIFSDIQGYKDLKGKIAKNFSKYYYLMSSLKPETWMKNILQFSIKNYGKPCTMAYEWNVNNPLYHNHSVISVALQLATYLGFKKIVFLGVDLDFSKEKGHSYDSSKDEKKRQINISIKREDKMLEWLNFACHLLAEKGIKCYNASPSGQLNSIKRIDLNEFISRQIK